MHEQWKKRKMFSNREQGIMSGLDPVPMVQGGYVPYPGMQTGGLFIPENEYVDPSPKGDTLTEETKILNTIYNDIIKTMLETQTPFETIIENRLSQGSLTFKAAEALKKVFAIQKMRQAQKNKEIDFFPSGPPTKRDALEYLNREQEMLQPSLPKMQVGGVVPQAQLFEEGDNELNEALNNLATVTKPDVPDTPTPMMEDKPKAKKETTTDQGFSAYKEDVMNLKEKFKDEIMSYLSKGNTSNLREYLTSMNITYTNQLDELKKKHNVEMNSPEDELMTPEFLEDLMRFTEAPGMEGGGAVPIDLEAINTQQQLNDLGLPYTIQAWLGLTEDGRKIAYNLEQQRKAAAIQQGGTTKLDELLQQRESLVDELGDAAAFEYKTKEGGAGGLIGKLLAQRAGRAKARDKILSDQISAERFTSRSGGINTPAKVLESIVLGDDREIEKKIAEYRTTFENDYGEDASDAAIGRLALDGIAPPKSSGPIYQQTLPTPDGDQTFIEFFNINYKRLLDNNEPTDGAALASIVRRWRKELMKS